MDEDVSKYLEDIMKGDDDPFDDDDAIVSTEYPAHRVKKRVKAFIGSGPYSYAPLEVPRYYSDLLAWAFDRELSVAGWNLVAALDTRGVVPGYRSVSVGPGVTEEKLASGVALLVRDNQRMVATLSQNHDGSAALVLTSPASNVEDLGSDFVAGVRRIMREENLYKGGKIQLEYWIRFLELPEKGWDDLVLPPGMKQEVMAHSVDFLRRADQLAWCGISERRGILLAGRPGTGKTLLCKVLMNSCPGVTCINVPSRTLTSSYGLGEVYELARDLSPCIVFLEDVDLVGQGRFESCYSRGEALAELLHVLDGIEDCHNVVTVATTNWLDILDEALKDRPSRFDRIISVDPPNLKQRMELLEHLARRIPMPASTIQHLSSRSDGMTPAQIQEVVHAVVIESGIDPTAAPNWDTVFTPAAVDGALARVRRQNGRVGFNAYRDRDN